MKKNNLFPLESSLLSLDNIETAVLANIDNDFYRSNNNSDSYYMISYVAIPLVELGYYNKDIALDVLQNLELTISKYFNIDFRQMIYMMMERRSNDDDKKTLQKLYARIWFKGIRKRLIFEINSPDGVIGLRNSFDVTQDSLWIATIIGIGVSLIMVWPFLGSSVVIGLIVFVIIYFCLGNFNEN